MANYVTSTSDKKRGIALILCIFLGFFGGHLWYVGRWGKALVYCFTLGFFFIGIIVDFVSILLGSFKDNVGAPLREW